MKLVLDASPEDLKVFLEEAEELLQLLDEDLIALEKGSETPDLLQEIFRAAHTLKGSSSALGHKRMADLTHIMETVLDKLRQGQLRVSTPVVSALLDGLDALRGLKDEIETMEVGDADLSETLARLSQVCDEMQPPPERAENSDAPALELGEEDEQEVAAANERGEAAYLVGAVLDGDNQFKAVRAWQLLSELSQAGKIIRSVPTKEDIEMERVEGSLQILIATPWSEEQVRAVAAQVPDLLKVEIREATADEKEKTAPGADDYGKSNVTVLAPPNGKSKAEENGKGPKLAKTVRIDIGRLDTMMNLVGELVIERTRLLRLGDQLGGKYADEGLVRALGETTQHVGRITDQLQEEITKARLLQIDTVFNKFPRLVRDLAVGSGKKVDFIIEGQDTELDRSVIEEIGDPLVHLLRNAVDHGIEPPDERIIAGKPEIGTIFLSARHEENGICITIEDDGRGIDPRRLIKAALAKGTISQESAGKMSEKEAVNLVFASGLSTAEKVTQVSGRGVGMDIVRTNIERVGGSIDIETKAGQGTVFTIKLPLTLAIIQALLVAVGSTIYAIPLATVAETFVVAPDHLQAVGGRAAILHRGEVLPLIDMDAVFTGTRTNAAARGALPIIATKFSDRRLGLVVHSLLGEQEIVIKPLGGFMGEVAGIAGATILGDGQVGLVVDVPSLVRSLA